MPVKQRIVHCDNDLVIQDSDFFKNEPIEIYCLYSIIQGYPISQSYALVAMITKFNTITFVVCWAKTKSFYVFYVVNVFTGQCIIVLHK